MYVLRYSDITIIAWKIHFQLPFIDPIILIVTGNGPIHHV